MKRFSVGDVVVCIRAGNRVPSVTVGDEFTVIAICEGPSRSCAACGVGYLVAIVREGMVYGCHHSLRLKQPPDHPNAKGSWDACPWRPSTAVYAGREYLGRPYRLEPSHPILEIVRDELADLFHQRKENPDG